MSKKVLIIRIEFLARFEKILQKDFHCTCCWVEINLHIHLVATENIVFDGMHAISLKGDSIFDRANNSKNTS